MHGNAEMLSWPSALEGVGEKLDKMIASSEQTFLALGDNLREFHERSQAMCTQSSEMLKVMTGEGLSGAIAGINEILEELNGFVNTPETSISRTIGVFNEHVETLKKLSSSLEGLNMLVLNLSMLGFLTRVENAHISSHNTGFASLTDDVKRLAELIRQKSSQINSKSDTVLSFITQAHAKVSEFKGAQHDQIHDIMHKSFTSHQNLVHKYRLASDSTHNIEQGTRSISSSIGDMVMSLQFHDIIRQQVGHVKEVLESLCRRIGEKDHSTEEVAAFVRDVCNLQHAQIRQSKDELTENVIKIIQSLRTISGSIHEIRKVTQGVALASETSGVSFMEEIDAGISTVITCLKASSEEQAKITATVTSTSQMASEMSGFVRDIETLGMNLQLIALNARIKAAHLGQEGAVLDTISGGIYELSKNAREDTRHLSELLSGLVSLSGSFKEDYQGMQEGQTRKVDMIIGKLRSLMESLETMDRNIVGMLSELAMFSDNLMKDIDRAASTISVHENVQAILEEAMHTVFEVAQSARQICPTVRIAESSSFFADIDKLYTMESEREVHLKHLGFSKDAGPKAIRAEQPDDLGDNVELF